MQHVVRDCVVPADLHCPFFPVLGPCFPRAQTNYLPHLIILLVVLLLAAKRLRNRAVGNTIFLVGERGTGKTEFLYTVMGAQSCQKCPSAKNNESRLELAGREYRLVDVAGHKYMRLQLLRQLGSASQVLVFADGSSAQLAIQCAEWVYSVLIEKAYQESGARLTVVLNGKGGSVISQADFLRAVGVQLAKVRESRRSASEDSATQNDIFLRTKGTIDLSRFGVRVASGFSPGDRKAAIAMLL